MLFYFNIYQIKSKHPEKYTTWKIKMLWILKGELYYTNVLYNYLFIFYNIYCKLTILCYNIYLNNVN